MFAKMDYYTLWKMPVNEVILNLHSKTIVNMSATNILRLTNWSL